MQFTLIDRITDLQPEVSITAVKTLLPTEEYLQDHFPRFPVMPGVLTLETMYQASAWLIHKTEGFIHGVILLKEARNVKFADFLQPGETIVVTSEITKQDPRLTTFKARGVVNNVVAVNGTLILERFNIADLYPDRAAWDAFARKKYRIQFQRLYQPAKGTNAAAHVSQVC